MVEICGRVCASGRSVAQYFWRILQSSFIAQSFVPRERRTKSGFLHSVQLGKLTLHLGNYVRRGNVKIISEAHIFLLRHAMFFRISQFGAARQTAEHVTLFLASVCADHQNINRQFRLCVNTLPEMFPKAGKV